MIEKNIRFEKQGDLYKLFYNTGIKECDMGISFMTEHNIEDYPITMPGVVLTTNAPHDKGISNFIVENILFKKDSSLEAKDTKGKGTSIKLSNIIVEGEAGLASKIDYTMESSILAKGTTSLASGDEELKILNSIFQGKNTISGVISITNSKIEDSILAAVNNAKIEDTELVDVTDYKAYIQPKVEDISIITNEIEKL